MLCPPVYRCQKCQCLRKYPPNLYLRMLCFRNARYLTSIAKMLGEKPRFIKAWDKRANNGFSYLLHITNGAGGKAQYDPSEVTANFDYAALVTTEIPAQIAEAKEKQSGTVKALLDMMYMGLKTEREVEVELSGSQYGKYRSQIEAVWAKRLQMMAEEWRKEKLAEGAQVQTVWLYGPAGCGKTSFAKAHARKKDQDYYVSGPSRDPFQSYPGEHTIILDELRANALSFADLLRILDPFSIVDQVMAPARYPDRALACDLIMVTTPFDPLKFYKEMFGPYALTTQIDNFRQLWRRLSLVIKMDYDCMEVMTMDGYGFHAVPGTSAPNPYSAKNRPAPKVNSLDLYRSMLDSSAPVDDTTTEK